jgi:uncharacterized protein YndB with AHSA1/START domain
MTQIYTTIQIQTPIQRVFDYVTMPGNWPVWHPSSLGGATDHSLEPGEEVTEEFLVAGRRGRVVWTVRERVAPRRRVIDGRVEGGGGTITYTATPHDAGTTSSASSSTRRPTGCWRSSTGSCSVAGSKPSRQRR